MTGGSPRGLGLILYYTLWCDVEIEECEDNTVTGDGDLCSMINGPSVPLLVQSPEPANTPLQAAVLWRNKTQNYILEK